MIQFERESKLWVAYGALWVALSVLMGAAGKHVLTAAEELVRAENLSISSTYGMVLGLSLIVLSAMRRMQFWRISAPWPERSVGIGLFFFSGGLIIRSFVPESVISNLLSPCIPFGGVLLSVGFIWLIIQTIMELFVKNAPE